LPFLAWPGGQKSSPVALLALPVPLLPLAVSPEEALGGEAVPGEPVEAAAPLGAVPEAEPLPLAEPLAAASEAPEEVLPLVPEAPELSFTAPVGAVLLDELAGEALVSDAAPVLPEVTELLEEPVVPLVPLAPLEGRVEEGEGFVAVP